METSLWIEEAVHPVTGEKKLFQGDTVEQLEQQIAAWQRADQDANLPRRRATAPSTGLGPDSVAT
jgi:hypothetical protein